MRLQDNKNGDLTALRPLIGLRISGKTLCEKIQKDDIRKFDARKESTYRRQTS